MITALIGYNGVVGSVLNKNLNFDYVFNSHNISEIGNLNLDLVYCAAPYGHRLFANKDPLSDINNINILINNLNKAKIKNLILISTVDTICQTTAYATNRLYLENCIKNNFKHKIVRLPTLIDLSIKKNICYDLKNNQFINEIKLHDILQWYPLKNLSFDLEKIKNVNVSEINFVSEPIVNEEIVDCYFPNLKAEMQLQKENSYNLKYLNNNFLYKKDEIFKYMDLYFNEIQ